MRYNYTIHNMADLKAMEQVTVETVQPDKEEAEEYTGVRILDLLDAANLSATYDVPVEVTYVRGRPVVLAL